MMGERLVIPATNNGSNSSATCSGNKNSMIRGNSGSAINAARVADKPSAGTQDHLPPPAAALRCPRCDSSNTKFCYYNNYSLSQPRHFCKACKRYWTRGGTLRNVPVGGGCRKNRRLKIKQLPAGAAAAATKLPANDPLMLPPPRSTSSIPALPPSAAVVDADGGSSSSVLCSLPALPSGLQCGPASCTGAAFDLHRHRHAAIISAAGPDDLVHPSHDEYRRLGGGELLEHLPQRLTNDVCSLLLRPKKSEEEEEEEEEEAAAARLLFDQQMMIMMNSTSTEWQIPTDQNISLPQINNPSFSSSSSPSYAYLKEASSSMICWPDAAAAANYRW